jgi:hypothetical protein
MNFYAQKRKLLMKFLPFSILLFTIAASAFVANGTAIATGTPTLQDNMKAIGKIVKSITLAAGDKTKNAVSADQAKQLAALFSAVLLQEPDSILQMPANQQAAALAEFKQLIQQELTDSGRLQTAFETNDNSAASATLKDMQADKATGHDKFNKN